MFKDQYPATYRAAKAFMEKCGGRETNASAASASTAGAEGMPLRLTIELPTEGAAAIAIRLTQSGRSLTVTLDQDGRAERQAKRGFAS